MRVERQNTRWLINKKGKLRLEPKPQAIICNVHDLSLSGIRISLARRLARDTHLKLSIIVANDLEFSVSTWVAWHKIVSGLNVYGLYFAKISESDKEKISGLIRKISTQEKNAPVEKDLKNQEKGGENMEDNRIFERFPTNFPLRFINLKENKEGNARTQDISAKGVGFLSGEDIKTHTPLEMWLEIPDRGEPLYARGEVVWSAMVSEEAYRIGVSLDKADLMGMSRVLRVAKT